MLFLQATSVSATEIVCNLPDLPAGTYGLELYIDDKGKATKASNRGFDVTINVGIDSISPTSGSMAGGALLTISGTGFPLSLGNILTNFLR